MGGGDGLFEVEPVERQQLVRLLIYGYTTGGRSSRAIERRCADDIAFRFLAADQASDFRSISRFRRRHQSLHLAQKLGMVKRGRVALDGTKLEANASKHKATSYGRLVVKEERIEAEIAALEAQAAALLADAGAADTTEGGAFRIDGKDTDLPAEPARREKRLARSQAARAPIESEAADERVLPVGGNHRPPGDQDVGFVAPAEGGVEALAFLAGDEKTGTGALGHGGLRQSAHHGAAQAASPVRRVRLDAIGDRISTDHGDGATRRHLSGGVTEGDDRDWSLRADLALVRRGRRVLRVLGQIGRHEPLGPVEQLQSGGADDGFDGAGAQRRYREPGDLPRGGDGCRQPCQGRGLLVRTQREHLDLAAGLVALGPQAVPGGLDRLGLGQVASHGPAVQPTSYQL